MTAKKKTKLTLIVASEHRNKGWPHEIRPPHKIVKKLILNTVLFISLNEIRPYGLITFMND